MHPEATNIADDAPSAFGRGTRSAHGAAVGKDEEKSISSLPKAHAQSRGRNKKIAASIVERYAVLTA
jgi:hypothetical protein